MLDLVITFLFAVFAGLLAGLLPGIGSTAVLIAGLPLLYNLPPEICILYYAVAVQSAQFSGSVSAINFGIIGELTSYPALAERQNILHNGLQKTALKFTALGSLISCVLPAVFLYTLLDWFRHQSIMMRTDFLFTVIVIIFAAAVFYKKNSATVNTILLICGVVVSQIGLRMQGGTEQNFLTFDQPWLYAGIPMISLLGGLVAVPMIVNGARWSLEETSTSLQNTQVSPKFNLFSSIRGGIIGLFCGLIPAIGTQISSGVAWALERRFYSTDKPYDFMSRLTSAESANNSSQITVLVPLLVIGLAIVPSEMILLDLIEMKFWYPGQETWSLYGIEFYQWLGICLAFSAAVCFLVCYTFISVIHIWLKNNLVLLNRIALVIISLAIFYAGSLVEARLFFIASFVILACIGLLFLKVDFIPLIAGYFLGDVLIDSVAILRQLYF